jgi:hypothetical protein
VFILATPARCIIAAQGPTKGGHMAERNLTAREDRFIGLCLVAATIVVIFTFIVSSLQQSLAGAK